MFGRIAAAFLLCAAAFGQTADHAFRRALALHQSGDLSGAIDAYQECLRLDAKRYDAQSNAGAALSAMGRYREAVEQYQKALLIAPAQFAPRLRQNLALAFYKSGQFADAITILKENGPAGLQGDLLLADCYLQNGEPEKAADTLGPYETSNPDDKGVAYVLGTALIRSGQVPHGQKVIDRILRDGDSAESRFLVGVTMFVAADYPAAVKQLAGGTLELNANLPFASLLLWPDAVGDGRSGWSSERVFERNWSVTPTTSIPACAWEKFTSSGIRLQRRNRCWSRPRCNGPIARGASGSGRFRTGPAQLCACGCLAGSSHKTVARKSGRPVAVSRSLCGSWPKG